jgi:hypothetical protein
MSQQKSIVITKYEEWIKARIESEKKQIITPIIFDYIAGLLFFRHLPCVTEHFQFCALNFCIWVLPYEFNPSIGATQILHNFWRSIIPSEAKIITVHTLKPKSKQYRQSPHFC